ncbi:MAG: hypothetical protein KAQ89_04780 [Planctomycetes bacterium]|nr:hypothetical protein [Planctomycetota bacterium]
MKKLIFITLLVLLVGSSSVFAASYTYTVSGKVYNRFSMQTVSGATVKHTIYWGDGSSSTQTKTSANDGSYTFTRTSVNDPNAKSMALTATSGSQKGGICWTSASYSESKWCPIDSIMLDPMLRFQTGVARMASPGVQASWDPAIIYLDDIGGPQEVTSYQVSLAFEPMKINCEEVVPSQTYSSFNPIIDNMAGTITVEAILDAPVMIGDINVPTELFQMSWNLLEAEPVCVTSVITDANSGFIVNGVPENAVINQSDHLVGEPDKCKPTFLLETQDDWMGVLQSEWPSPSVSPIFESQWEFYMEQLGDSNNTQEGEPYPDVNFQPAELWVYGGGGSGGTDPNDAGLVMFWGSNSLPDGNYATAFRYDYGLDPDLRNSTITITVTAPQFGPAGQVNAVSFSIVDIAGLRRSWWWSVGPAPAPIQWNTPTKVTIDTSKTGLIATTPVATGYSSAAGFNLSQSQNFDVDENFQWIFGQIPVPPPGQPTFVGMWNYWHNLLVTKNTNGSADSKWYVKWSQPPVVIDDNEPPLINGWDELSDYNNSPIMADDWECTDERPITDIHWWGSFLGWTQPTPPPIVPKQFHIGIWTDVPDPNPNDPNFYSQPGVLIWENFCDSSVWNFAGYDVDPQNRPEYEDEACFQFAQFLSEDEWFHQEPNELTGTNVYWLSIAAIYDPCDPVPAHPWGWKTRPHFFNDDAVRITDVVGSWPPVVGSVVNGANPVYWPDPNDSWDLAFELTTNDPGEEPESADLNRDGFVDFSDFAVFADQWLTTGL